MNSETLAFASIASDIMMPVSRDGDYLYFLAADTDDLVESRTLYQVAALGGSPRRLIDDVVDPVTTVPTPRRSGRCC
jgi:hypothetical protein